MRLSFTLCFLSVGLLACDGTPQHRVDFASGEELGAVRITERSVVDIGLTNTGQQPVTLEGVGLELGHSGTIGIDASVTDCVPGLTLAVGQGCSIGVAFEPGNDITYRDSLHVDYRPENGIAAFRTTLSVSGLGVLDCSLREDYMSSFEMGSADAEAQIALDIVEATAAGEALTGDDGYTDGYDDSYDVAYDSAFDSAYDEGRGQGYEDGYAEGASAAACLEGELDGYADGSDAGLEDGEEDGLLEGDDQGYDDGYANGRLDGEDDTCFVEKVDLDPSLPGKCTLQGYDATYSRGPYNAAFEAAVAANAAYQDGLSLGEQDGMIAGQADGSSEGFADGYRDGADLGFADGDADEYEACYALATDEGYEDGYLSAYDEFFNAAYEDAYADGYEDGYAAGSLECF
ncbi:MAG: hypothetical protein AB8H86_16980 [Polyangiales bacterium]